jgi:chlorophyll synthase
MTLNDFKSVEGDTRMGIGSLPVKLGVDRAAQVACGVMVAPQVVVVALLVAWGRPWHAGAIAVLLAVQVVLMQKLLADPRGKAPWYNGTGTTLYVLGMLLAAFALRPVAGVMP